MGKLDKKKAVSNANIKKSRKELRKEQRQQKKVRKNDFYTNRYKPGKFVLRPKDDEEFVEKPVEDKPLPKKNNNNKKTNKEDTNLLIDLSRDAAKEKRDLKKLKLEMKQNKKQMMLDMIKDDRDIKRCEKQLKLNKRKTKAVPASFAMEGFDYLLELCDSETRKEVITTESQLDEVNDYFEEDLALMAGKGSLNKNKVSRTTSDENHDFNDELSSNASEDERITSDINNDDINEFSNTEDGNDTDKELNDESEDINNEELNDDDFDDNTTDENDFDDDTNLDSNTDDENHLENKRAEISAEDKGSDDDMKEATYSDDEVEPGIKKKKISSDGTWEDIYGKIRDKDGKIITQEGKYVPPAIRAQLESNLSEDIKRTEKLIRLKKLLKGLLNRLAESNMHSISNQIEGLYMQNSRNDMNETLTNLIFESIITNVHTPERLLLEHVLLIVILHANVGTEIGAHFLQIITKKFDELYHKDVNMEDKTLDNVVNVISQIYNFKVFHSQLLYQILQKLSQKFEEKHVECILNILKSVGFTLRKDDPLALKDLILDLQKRAASASDDIKENPRVKFMLDILLAIKNNNVNKIPNYDTTYSQHLKKISKSSIRKGNYVTQLNISLDDLLKADEQGKWWVVGSAWIGKSEEETSTSKKQKGDGFSKKILKLAKSQRMNTDTRRNIFCIIMSAEDYLDAFEKILHLGLKNQQEREIINVLLHCCLQEKNYNPYYSVLSQKFCDYDRKYQVTIKYAIWDKLKTLTECSAAQISNLAKLLTHLFLEKGLAISTLKIVQFSELEKVTLRFIRQILLGVLLSEDVEQCQGVFEKVAQSEKLKMFRESLRLFIHHFLLRNIKQDSIEDHQKILLEERAKMVEKILMANEAKNRF